MTYEIDLDEFSADVSCYLESNQDGNDGHRATFEADSPDEALERVMLLLEGFVREKLRQTSQAPPLTLDEAAKAFNPFGDRTDHWKAAVRLQDEHEATVAAAFESELSAQINEVAALIRDGSAWEPFMDADAVGGLFGVYEKQARPVWLEFAGRTYEAVDDQVQKSLHHQQYGRLLFDSYPATKGADDHRPTWLRRFRTFLGGPALTRVTAINQTTREFIRGVLTRASDEDVGATGAARLLRREWEGVSKAHAQRIARTEIVGWANRASLVGADSVAQEPGLAMKKEWIATRDGRVRDTHAAADGQVVDKDASFSVGGSFLMYPGDQSAAASEVANCRCAVGFIVE